MPWRMTSMLSQRSQFILELKSGEYSLSELCRKYDISRPTGYKWKERFSTEGILGLNDRSRRPVSQTPQVPQEIVSRIVSYRVAHPSWGATKIRKILLREFKKVPSRRTIHRVLQECNLISTRRMHTRRKQSERMVLKAKRCNHIWTVDFKGWWRTKDGKKVYPLTIRDEYSKMVLAVEMLPSPTLELTKEAFIRCFERFGLPEYIRSDNGTPFAYSQGLCGLSRLSAWWMKLGVVPNFIPPGSPQYNGGHERMHRDMKKDMQFTPALNIDQQQVVATEWKKDFNTVRPHDMLNDKTPSQVYRRSPHKYRRAEPPLEYPLHMKLRYVNKQGWFKFGGKRIFLSKAIGGENIGLDFTHPGHIDIWFANTILAQGDTSFSQKIIEYNLISGLLSDNKLVA